MSKGNGIGLNYENIKDSLPQTDFEKQAANLKLDAKLNGMNSTFKKNLDKDLNDLDDQKELEEEEVINTTKHEITKLRSSIADLNNNLETGTKVKREKKHNRLEAKQEKISQSQKDSKDKIAAIITEQLGAEYAMLVNSFIDKGVLTRLRFEKGLKEMYLAAKFPHYKDASKEAKKEMRANAKEWADKVSDKIKASKLWREAKFVNINEKASDRMEVRKQRATEYNNAESLFTEYQVDRMFDGAIKIMGGKEFAEALYTKISMLRPYDNMPEFGTVEELNKLLDTPEWQKYITNFVVENLPYMTKSSMIEWLSPEQLPGEVLDRYKAEIEAQHAEEINTILQSLYPNLTQAQMRKKRADVVAGIAAGVMHVADQNTGMEIRGAGVGAGVTLNGLDRVQPIISRMSIGVAVAQTGVPGIAIDFGKDISWKTGGVHLDAGVANFVIPFARVGIDQTINMGKLKRNLEAKKAWKVGAYAEATTIYAGVGLNIGTNALKGIDKQEKNDLDKIYTLLISLDKDSGVLTVMQELKKLYKEADQETLEKAAKRIVTGLKQGYSAQDITEAFATEAKNEKLKSNIPGKVDFSVEAGVGMLLTVPVIKAFAGATIYRRSSTLSDKYDRDAKEQSLSKFKGFQKFENSDVEDMTIAEKVQYWLGEENATIVESKNSISILRTTEKNPIYDMFDVYVKDPSVVKVTDNAITFSKNSNILLGKLISGSSERQKIYIGYDKESDVKAAKFPLNNIINGNPDLVPALTTETVVNAQSLSFDVQERINVHADYFNKAKNGCIEATDQVQAKKYEYNTYCQDLFIEIKRYAERRENFEDVLGSFNQLMNRIGVPSLNVKDTDPRNEIINQMLNTIAYSAKAWNLNALNPNALKGKNKPKDISTLINRKGAIEAFKKGGYDLKPTEFDALHATAKGEVLYKQVAYPNAISVVSYYRNVAPKTPMNMTAMTGFNAVNLAHSNKNGELLKDASVDAKTQDKVITDLINNPQEFAVFEARISSMLATAGIATLFTHENYADLLRGEKVNGVTLNKQFFKAFNGPCVNEAIILNLLGIHIDTYTTKNPRSPEIYVGMEHVDNYVKAHKVNVGIGAMYGNKPKPKQPEWENGKPESEPGDNPNPTDVNNGGQAGTGVGEDPKPTDPGNGGGGE